MAGLDPAIHALRPRRKDVDARHKAGHDGGEASGPPHASAYFPRPKKRSFCSGLAVSRLDFTVATLASAAFTASRAPIWSTQALIFGYLAASTPRSSKLRSQGKAAMSAMV